MNHFWLKTAAAAIVLGSAGMASAQHAGHTMPMPAAKKPAAKKPVAKKAVAKKPVAKKAAVKKAAVKKPAAKAPAARQKVAEPAATPMLPAAEPLPVDHSAMGHGTAPAPIVAPSAPPIDHSALGHDRAAAAAPTVDHSNMNHAAAGHSAMRGALGPYPMSREASGTAWQPDTSEHLGLMGQSGAWTLMAHGNLDLIADTQSGPRGDDKLFVAGMLMGMAKREFASGDALQFKAMVSPDPLMGKRGYPLLLASGETADGETRLVDRQHPHDFFMELSASYSFKLSDKSSAFIYSGLPGEPAFGPPAFMHRQSTSVSPEAPITHHWLDSTHITFGVVTGGLVLDRVKIEASRFNGREPDEKRWDIETAPLDSTSIRLSWNPARELSLQGSWAHLKEPEQLEPGVNQKRWSASAIYTRPTANGWWSSTAAWGRKTLEGESYDAFALESAYKWKAWTLFGRGEITENNELSEVVEHHGPAYRVGKAAIGLARDIEIGGPLTLVVGGLASINFVPDALEHDYGKTPLGAMGFVRLKLD